MSLLLLMSGCNKTELVPQPNYSDGKIRTDISIENNTGTKGAPLTTIPDFSMFGYTYDSGIGTANYMYNERMSKNSSGIFVSDEKHSRFSGKAFFWGIAPINATGVTLPSEEATGDPEIIYNSPSTAVTQQDIVISKYTTTNGIAENLQLPGMTFNHILSGIKFKFNDDGAFNGTLKKIVLKNIYTSGVYDISSDAWTNVASKGNVNAQMDIEITEDMGGSDITTPEQTFMLIPQSMPSDASLMVYINDGENDRAFTVSLSNISLEKGKIHTFHISLKTEQFKFFFTVNDEGKKVVFSPGNLYWDGSEFKFEEHQYDYPETREASHIGHFFWTKDARVAYADNLSNANSKFNITPSNDDIFFAVNGGAIEGYTVLSNDEFLYLRDNAYEKTVKINGIECAIFKPDEFNGIVADSYTDSEWATAESTLGLVALPQAGEYFSDVTYDCLGTPWGGRGEYWTSTIYENWDHEYAYAIFITEQTYNNSRNYKRYGMSVRLIKVINP